MKHTLIFFFFPLPLGDHIQARGTHINFKKPQKGKISCQGTFKMYLMFLIICLMRIKAVFV